MRIFNISPYHSNSMLSDNPNSGIQEVTTSRTLDVNGGNPACNQGGLMILTRSKDEDIRSRHGGGQKHDAD